MITSEYLQQMLLLNYCKRQGKKIKEYVREGIQYAGVDWSTMANPTGLFIYFYIG